MTTQPPVGNSSSFAAVPLEEPGTATEDWVAAARSLPPLDTRELEHLVLVVAHPDDECLGPGALVSVLSMQGKRITVIIVSDGARSHDHLRDVAPQELSAARRAESVAASRILGTETPIFLGYPDGELEAHSSAIVHELEQIFHRATRENDGTMSTVLTHWRGDGHPDHETVGRSTAQATESLLNNGRDVTLLEFPLWALHWDTPQRGRFLTGNVTVGPRETHGLLNKRRAAACFSTQILPWSQAAIKPVIPEHVLQRFLNAPELYLDTSQIAVPTVQSQREDVDGREHLEMLYAQSRDPWNVETSSYEQAKRLATLNALPRDRYGLCFDVGCSIGTLTADLARRAEQVIGWEPVERAASRARARINGELTKTDAVTIECRALSARDGELGPYGADLVVLSEVLYYIPPPDLAPTISGLCDRASAGANVVAVHWRHPVSGWPDGGAATHAVLFDEPSLRHIHRDNTSRNYLLDVFEVEQEM